MFNPGTVSGQRWSALWNGLVIGFGIQSLIFGGVFGILLIAVGVGLEYWQRRRFRGPG